MAERQRGGSKGVPDRGHCLSRGPKAGKQRRFWENSTAVKADWSLRRLELRSTEDEAEVVGGAPFTSALEARLGTFFLRLNGSLGGL